MKGGFILNDNVLRLFDTQEPYREQDAHYQIHRNMRILNDIFQTPNITVTLISDASAYGYIFKVDLPPNVPNEQHIAFEYNPNCDDEIQKRECYTPVRSYIIKLVFIGQHDNNIPGTSKSYNGRVEFTNESQMQYDLYNQKFMNGLYLIPPMLTRDPLFIRDTAIFDSNLAFQNMILGQFQNLVNIHQIVQQFSAENDIGLVLMGFAQGYTTIRNALSQYPLMPEMQTRLRLFGKFAHLLFCILYGYGHGDHHLDNVMVNVNYPSPHEWYNGIHQGRVLLIDFGRSKKLPELHGNGRDVKQMIDTYIAQHNYTDLLRLIHTLSLSPQEYIQRHPVYRWLGVRETTLDQNETLHTMLANYFAFQNDPNRREFAFISIPSMMRNHIFKPVVNRMKMGGRKTHKSRKYRKGYKLRKYRKSNRRK